MRSERSLLAAVAIGFSLVHGGVAQQRPQSNRVRALVDSLARAAIGAGRMPGLSIEVVRAGVTLVRRGYGLADLEQRVPASASTLYEIGSITKQFTAAAVMRLVERGRVRLDDSIATFVPNLPAPWRRATIRQLLSHTSGIPSYTDIGDRWQRRFREDMPTDTLIALTAGDSGCFAPGTGWRYDNTGYVLLGVLLDHITGQAYPTYVESSLLRPLGLDQTFYCDQDRILPNRAAGYQHDSTGWHHAPYLSMTQPYSAGALCSTVGDLARWNVLLATGAVVSGASYRAMTTPEGPAASHHYGFGLIADTLGGRRVIVHGGGIPGFASANAYFPDDSLSVTVLTNTSSSDPGPLADNVARAALGVPLARASAPASH